MNILVIAYGSIVVIVFRSPWGVSGLNACHEADALDRSGKVTGRMGALIASEVEN